jgi:putative membrane protein
MKRAPCLLAGAGVLVQVAYPLTSGSASVVVTVTSVVLLSVAALAHVLVVTGSMVAPIALLLTTGGVGWAAEAIGVHTGFPFGTYRYTALLGPSVGGVPLVVPLAWTMLAYPCLLLGRWLGSGSHWRTVVFGGLALASWDLFLDPQLVALGGWRWAFPSPALPGVPGIPLTNYAGWVLVSLILVAVLDRVLGFDGLTQLTRHEHAVPAAVLTWTWLGSAVGNLMFFGRPAVALYGGVAMGVFVMPYLRGLARREPLRGIFFQFRGGAGRSQM